MVFSFTLVVLFTPEKKPDIHEIGKLNFTLKVRSVAPETIGILTNVFAPLLQIWLLERVMRYRADKFLIEAHNTKGGISRQPNYHP